jgi:hypothetical protein
MKNPATSSAGRRAGLRIEKPTNLSTRSLAQPNPPCNINVAASELREMAVQVYALGPRPFCEFLREVVAGGDVLDCLERYAGIDGRVLELYGGSDLRHRLRLGGER